GSPQEFCAIANYRSDDFNVRYYPEARHFAAFLIFGAFVRPGATAEDMRVAVPEPRWLDYCKVSEPILIWSGDKPLLLNGTYFCLTLFPDEQGDSKWTMYFTLSNSKGERGMKEDAKRRTREDAVAFLKGNHPDKSLK